MARRLAVLAGPPLAALAVLLAAPAAADDIEHHAPTAKNPRNPIAVDLNGDGHVDLVAGTSSNVLTVLLGQGDGTFAPHIESPVSAPVSELAAADFDGDGHPDLAGTTAKSVVILHGSGDGRFAQAGSPANRNAGAPVAGDFNSDGHPDMAVAHPDSATVQLFINKGDGSFGPPATITLAHKQPVLPSMVSADFNGDGRPDLATPADLLTGNGDATFTSAPTGVRGGTWAATADVNRDKRPDLLVVRQFGQKLVVLLGGAQPAQSFLTLPAPTNLSLADVDGDGHLDAVMEEDLAPGISVMFGGGDGTFGPGLEFAYSIDTAADLSGDGASELIWADPAGLRFVSGKDIGATAPPARTTPRRKPKPAKLTAVKCNAPHEKTIAAGPKIRLFLQVRVLAAFGCWRAKGRGFRLDADYGDDNFIVHPELAGDFAAFGVDYAAGESADNGFQDISVWNVRKNVRVWGPVRLLSATNDEVDPGSTKLDALVLKPNGSIAWIAEDPGDLREVWKLDGGGIALLDSGGDIGHNSLKLAGSSLSWTSGGVGKTATLR